MLCERKGTIGVIFISKKVLISVCNALEFDVESVDDYLRNPNKL